MHDAFFLSWINAVSRHPSPRLLRDRDQESKVAKSVFKIAGVLVFPPPSFIGTTFIGGD